MQDNDLAHLTLRLKSLQHNMLQPETGQHMEYVGKLTLWSNEHVTTITICIYGWWRLYGYICIKLIFFLQQSNIFYLTTKFVENIKKGNPTILFNSDEILRILQVLDTQDVHNRGHG